MRTPIAPLTLLVTLALSLPASAGTVAIDDKATTPPDAGGAETHNGFLSFFKPIIDIRPRYEFRSEDGKSDSHAGTVRSRLGLTLEGWYGFSALAEYEGTVAVDRDSYQAASVHGLGQNKAVIADPESHELNRLWLGYEAFDTNLKGGRQRLIIDNQRFVGNVGWRQNEQTFDAVILRNASLDDIAVQYSYVNRVNRIFGSGDIHNPAHTDFTGNTHLFNVGYTGVPNVTVKGYAYWMDLHNDAGDAESNQSFGLSASGAVPVSESLKIPLYAEYAYQKDAFNSPLDYSAHYLHVSGGLDFDGHNVTVGYERLGNGNDVGFKTPLATLHLFNGLVDKFLRTPDDGLGDIYVAGRANLPAGFVLKPAFHWFGPAGGGFDYGKELDLVLVKKLPHNFTFLALYGHYWADTFSTDTDHVTVQVGWVF